MHTLTIETKKGKGRSFQATLLAWVEAPALFEGGAAETNNNRPVWISFATSEQESRMFAANFMHGRIAKCDNSSRYGRDVGTRFQLLKTAGYQAHVKKVGGGVVTTAYLPDLFYLDPGMVDPKEIRFVLLSSAAWRAQQNLDLDAATKFVSEQDIHQVADGERVPLDDLANLLSEALLFLLYVDRRTRFPIPPHPHFALQLLVRCLNERLAQRSGPQHLGDHRYRGRWGMRYAECGFDNLALPPGLGFQASHKVFGQLLAEEIQKWRVHNGAL